MVRADAYRELDSAFHFTPRGIEALTLEGNSSNE